MKVKYYSNMSCSICLCDGPTCTLKCGHTFHLPCIKKWFVKCKIDNETCPTCRNPMIGKRYTKWYNDKLDIYKNELYEDVITNTFDSYESDDFFEDTLLEDLRYIQKLYHEHDVHDFEQIITDPFLYMIYDYLVFTTSLIYDEPIFENIFIPKRHYGVVVNKCSHNLKIVINNLI